MIDRCRRIATCGLFYIDASIYGSIQPSTDPSFIYPSVPSIHPGKEENRQPICDILIYCPHPLSLPLCVSHHHQCHIVSRRTASHRIGPHGMYRVAAFTSHRITLHHIASHIISSLMRSCSHSTRKYNSNCCAG